MPIANTELEVIQPTISLEPLTQEQKDQYPHVIFGVEPGSASDVLRTAFAVTALNGYDDMHLAIDVEHDEETEFIKEVVVRTLNDDEFSRRTESALVGGVVSLQDHAAVEADDTPMEPYASVYSALNTTLLDLVHRKDFDEFYSGLRLGTAQDRIIHALFRKGLTTAEEVASQMTVTPDSLLSLSYYFDDSEDLPDYNARRELSNQTVEEIVSQYPALDVQRLIDDPEFKNSEQGIKLDQAVRTYVAEQISTQYKNGHHFEVERPVIPLSSSPILETLIADQAAGSKPRSKNSIGAFDVDDIVLRSDSTIALDAYVSSMTTRLQKEDRHVFDGPSEFQDKSSNVYRLIRSMTETASTERRAMFRDRVETVFDAYTSNGEIARSVRENNPDEYYVRSNAVAAKKIVKEILAVSLVTPGCGKMVAKYLHLLAEDAQLPLDDSSVVQNNLLADHTPEDELLHHPNELRLLFIDAVTDNRLSNETDLNQLEVFGSLYFSSEETQELMEIVRLRIEARNAKFAPEVEAARIEWRDTLAIFDKDEKDVLGEKYYELCAPANELYEQARLRMNAFALKKLEEIASMPEDTPGRYAMFNHILNDTYSLYGSEQGVTIPKEYVDIMEVAKHPGVSDRMKTDIVWKLSKHYRNVRGDQSRYLVTMMADCYELLLGDLDEPFALPSYDTRSGVSGVNHFIAEGNADSMHNAHPNDMNRMLKIREGLIDLVIRNTSFVLEQVADKDMSEISGLLDESARESGLGSKSVEYELGDLLRSFKSVESRFENFNWMDKVKTEPTAYYIHMQEYLFEFLVALRREDGAEFKKDEEDSDEASLIEELMQSGINKWNLDGMIGWDEEVEMFDGINAGRGGLSELASLHKFIDDFVNNRLIFADQVTEDTDVFEDGSIDELVVECYQRMIRKEKYHMGNIRAVWTEGKVLYHVLTKYMPESVFSKIQELYPDMEQMLQNIANMRRD